jgi:hypothetical protein
MQFSLTEEITKLSVSDYWDSAKLEWNFKYAYQSEQMQTCLCGHYPIKNICVIENTKNNNQTEVGNCCVNKFLGIDKGNKIFESIKRLKEDITKSISGEVLDYLFNKKIINKVEYDFYQDTLKKRNFTIKQLEFRERINQKFLDFTSYEANSFFIRINLVLNWAKNNKWFNTDFVESLRKSCEKNGKLTDSQSQALENIITKLKIE